MFLQDGPHIEEPIRASADTGCQFTSDFSWYSFVPSNSSVWGQVYTSTDTSTGSSAYFTYCYKKLPTHCTTSKQSYAAIKLAGVDECALQATEITGTTYIETDGEPRFALKYTNTNSGTNGGVTDLIVY